MMPMMLSRGSSRLAVRSLATTNALSMRSMATTTALSTKAKATLEAERWANHSRHSGAMRSSPVEGIMLAGALSGVMLISLAPAILSAIAPAKSD